MEYRKLNKRNYEANSLSQICFRKQSEAHPIGACTSPDHKVRPLPTAAAVSVQGSLAFTGLPSTNPVQNVSVCCCYASGIAFQGSHCAVCWCTQAVIGVMLFDMGSSHNVCKPKVWDTKSSSSSMIYSALCAGYSHVTQALDHEYVVIIQSVCTL